MPTSTKKLCSQCNPLLFLTTTPVALPLHSKQKNVVTNKPQPMCALPNKTTVKQRVLGKCPRSQHRSSLITPPKLKVPAHNDPVKRWNFCKVDWKRFWLLTGESVERLQPPDTSNIERAYTTIFAWAWYPRPNNVSHVVVTRTVRHAATKSARPSIAPSSELHCGHTDSAASSLHSRLEQKKQERWEQAVNAINFLHSSNKTWITINKVTGRYGRSSPVPVSANSIAPQLVMNGAQRIGGRETFRLFNKVRSDLWKIPTPEDHSITDPLRSEKIVAALRRLKPGKSPGLGSIISALMHATYCAPIWCRGAHTRLIDPAITDALWIVTGWMPASYTSGQRSHPRWHPTCWVSWQWSHTVSSTQCRGAWHMFHSVLTCPSSANSRRLKSRHPFVPAAQQLISLSDNNIIRAALWTDHQWNAEWADNPTRLNIFIDDTGIQPPEWPSQKQPGSGLTASTLVSDVSAPASTNGVWPPLHPVSVAQKNKPPTMLSSDVQSIELPVDCKVWQFWMLRQSNGCPEPAPKSNAAKQWFEELAQKKKNSFDSWTNTPLICILVAHHLRGNKLTVYERFLNKAKAVFTKLFVLWACCSISKHIWSILIHTVVVHNVLQL